MILSGLILLLGQVDSNSIGFDEPIETMKPSFNTEFSDWAFESLAEGLSIEEMVDGEKYPLALFLRESLLLPARKLRGKYYFSLGAESQPPKAVNEWTKVEWKEFAELKVSICEFSLADIQEIFVPPYIATARALPVQKVEWQKKETHQEIKFQLEDNILFQSVTCFVPLEGTLVSIAEALPGFVSIVMRGDLKKELPQEKDSMTVADFRMRNTLDLRNSESLIDWAKGSQFEDFMKEPYWTTRKGFDSWGYYERAETPIGENGRLRFEYRRYDSLFGPRWPCDRSRSIYR